MSTWEPRAVVRGCANVAARPVPRQSVVITCGAVPLPSVSQFVPVQSSLMAVSVARCNRYVALGSRSRTQVSRFTILSASLGWRNLTCPKPPLPVTSRRMTSSLNGGVSGPQLLALMRAFAGAPAETLGATGSGSAVQAINALVRAGRGTATGIRAIVTQPPRKVSARVVGVAPVAAQQSTG